VPMHLVRHRPPACVLSNNKMYNVTNPFDFMDMTLLESKTNSFERRVSDYSKANSKNVSACSVTSEGIWTTVAVEVAIADEQPKEAAILIDQRFGHVKA
jgi:hypothetical protein